MHIHIVFCFHFYFVLFSKKKCPVRMCKNKFIFKNIFQPFFSSRLFSFCQMSAVYFRWTKRTIRTNTVASFKRHHLAMAAQTNGINCNNNKNSNVDTPNWTNESIVHADIPLCTNVIWRSTRNGNVAASCFVNVAAKRFEPFLIWSSIWKFAKSIWPICHKRRRR